MRPPAAPITLSAVRDVCVNMWSVRVNWVDGIVMALSGRCVEPGRCMVLRHGWVGLLATGRP